MDRDAAFRCPIPESSKTVTRSAASMQSVTRSSAAAMTRSAFSMPPFTDGSIAAFRCPNPERSKTCSAAVTRSAAGNNVLPPPPKKTITGESAAFRSAIPGSSMITRSVDAPRPASNRGGLSTRLTKRLTAENMSKTDIFSEEEICFFEKLLKDISKSELTLNLVKEAICNSVQFSEKLEGAILMTDIEKRTSKDVNEISKIIFSIFKQ